MCRQARIVVPAFAVRRCRHHYADCCIYSDPLSRVFSSSSCRHSSGEGLDGVLAVVMLIVVIFIVTPPVSRRCHLSSCHRLLGLGMDGVQSRRRSMSSFLFDVDPTQPNPNRTLLSSSLSFVRCCCRRSYVVVVVVVRTLFSSLSSLVRYCRRWRSRRHWWYVMSLSSLVRCCRHRCRWYVVVVVVVICTLLSSSLSLVRCCRRPCSYVVVIVVFVRTFVVVIVVCTLLSLPPPFLSPPPMQNCQPLPHPTTYNRRPTDDPTLLPPFIPLPPMQNRQPPRIRPSRPEPSRPSRPVPSPADRAIRRLSSSVIVRHRPTD